MKAGASMRCLALLVALLRVQEVRGFSHTPALRHAGPWAHRLTTVRSLSSQPSDPGSDDAFDEPEGEPGPSSFRWLGEDLVRQTYIYEVRIRSPLGLQLAEKDITVSSGARVNAIVAIGITPDSNADLAGIRENDRVVATQATLGSHMWEKNTLDGVAAAVSSRLKYADDVRLRLERPFDSSAELSSRSQVPETFIVALKKPLGLQLTEQPDPARKQQSVVVVTGVSGNAAASEQIFPGDRICAVSASFGDGMWPPLSLWRRSSYKYFDECADDLPHGPTDSKFRPATCVGCCVPAPPSMVLLPIRTFT